MFVAIWQAVGNDFSKERKKRILSSIKDTVFSLSCVWTFTSSYFILLPLWMATVVDKEEGEEGDNYHYWSHSVPALF